MRQEMGKIHPRATLVPEQPKYESRSRRQQERPALVLGRRCRDNDTHVETAARGYPSPAKRLFAANMTPCLRFSKSAIYAFSFLPSPLQKPATFVPFLSEVEASFLLSAISTSPSLPEKSSVWSENPVPENRSRPSPSCVCSRLRQVFPARSSSLKMVCFATSPRFLTTPCANCAARASP